MDDQQELTLSLKLSKSLYTEQLLISREDATYLLTLMKAHALPSALRAIAFRLEEIEDGNQG